MHKILNDEAALEADWTFEVRIEFEADGHSYDLRRRAQKRSTVAVPQRPEDFQVQVYLKEDGIPVQGDLIESKINLVAPEQVSRFFLFDGELLQEYVERACDKPTVSACLQVIDATFDSVHTVWSYSPPDEAPEEENLEEETSV